jgi:hypothetical protein
MNTSRHYRNLTTPRQLSKNEGLGVVVLRASIAREELLTWISSLTPEDKINLLHVRTLGKITGVEIDMLLRIKKFDYESQTRRRKSSLERKEKEEIQAEEAIVRSLLTGA